MRNNFGYLCILLSNGVSDTDRDILELIYECFECAGHEGPFAIQKSIEREFESMKKSEDSDMKTDKFCRFILREKRLMNNKAGRYNY